MFWGFFLIYRLGVVKISKLSEIDIKTQEGQLLFAALAILTSISEEDIIKKNWGSGLNYDKALQKIIDLTNKIFHEREYIAEKIAELKTKKRDKKINKFLL